MVVTECESALVGQGKNAWKVIQPAHDFAYESFHLH